MTQEELKERKRLANEYIKENKPSPHEITAFRIAAWCAIGAILLLIFLYNYLWK